MHRKFGLLSPGKVSSHSMALPRSSVLCCVDKNPNWYIILYILLNFQKMNTVYSTLSLHDSSSKFNLTLNSEVTFWCIYLRSMMILLSSSQMQDILYLSLNSVRFYLFACSFFFPPPPPPPCMHTYVQFISVLAVFDCNWLNLCEN